MANVHRVGLRGIASLGVMLLLTIATAQARPPNIIMILADDLGWKDSGVYGSEFYETPGIDALAENGIRFTNAYAANPLCSPTRASLLTGQYPGRLRLTAATGHMEREVLDPQALPVGPLDRPAIEPQTRTRLPNDYVTYAQVLRDAGYVTAFMGKWHLGRGEYIPENQGFDVVVGGRHHPGPPAPGGFFAPWDIETIPDYPEGTHISDALTTEAIAFIEAHREQPFLLNLWFYDVHSPFMGKSELIDQFEQTVDPNGTQRSSTMAAMIKAMDLNIERLLAELDRLGIREETIIIFTSDNGGNMYDRVDGTTPTNNAPLRSGKGNNYEGGVRVPLIVDWPGVSKPDTVSDAVISSVDIYPTILHMAGLPQRPEYHIDGHDFTAAIEGKPFDRGATISHFPHYIHATNNIPSTSVRLGDYKLYRFYHAGENQQHHYELYNLKDDMGEMRNLADVMPDKVAQMDATIEQFLKDSGSLYPGKNPAYDPSQTNWTTVRQATLAREGDVLKIESLSNAPCFELSDFDNLSGPATMTFAIKSDSAGSSAFSWIVDGQDGYEKQHSVSFNLTHDNQWHNYTIELPFSGRLQKLQFDPSKAPGLIEIKFMKIENRAGQSVTLF